MVLYETLFYWINEREHVRLKKESGGPKPWSADPVFRTTYFCNVRREDDRVTRFIRKMYSPKVSHPLFVHNIILARMLNWPDTLDNLGYQEDWDPEYVNRVLHEISANGKIWGSAYIVSTCGRKMDKIDYLTGIVMPSIRDMLYGGSFDGATLAQSGEYLQKIQGISTFMAGQVVADLKNTPGHPLQDAPDWWTFALPGPGSTRGMDWLYGRKVPASEWQSCLENLQDKLHNDYWKLCRQDIQNCLCEFSKYMKVKTGSGRSKRSYDGV